MRRLYTTAELRERGVTRSALRTAVSQGRLRKAEAGVYAAGPAPLTALDRARAAVLASGGVASGRFAGYLLGLDGVEFIGPQITLPPKASTHRSGVERRHLVPERVVVIAGVPCTDGVQTLLDLGRVLDDAHWEQALESALRRNLVTVASLEAAAHHCRGTQRVRRVLGTRPPRTPATESLLETLMVQLLRQIPGVPAPERQVCVFNRYGEQVARVDLAWPELGLFLELDGQHHRDQPVYDASRETAVVAATGWLCGRFTWHEVVDLPVVTLRRAWRLIEQARLRPLRSGRAGRAPGSPEAGSA